MVRLLFSVRTIAEPSQVPIGCMAAGAERGMVAKTAIFQVGVAEGFGCREATLR